VAAREARRPGLGVEIGEQVAQRGAAALGGQCPGESGEVGGGEQDEPDHADRVVERAQRDQDGGHDGAERHEVQAQLEHHERRRPTGHDRPPALRRTGRVQRAERGGDAQDQHQHGGGHSGGQ
jgi:hypothetical protein